MDFISVMAISFIIFIVLWVITFFVLIFIIEQQSKLMATFQEFKDQLAAIATATDNIAEDLKRLADLIGAGGISAVEETELLKTLTDAAEKLKAVAAINPEPAPEEPPVEG